MYVFFEAEGVDEKIEALAEFSLMTDIAPSLGDSFCFEFSSMPDLEIDSENDIFRVAGKVNSRSFHYSEINIKDGCQSCGGVSIEASAMLFIKYTPTELAMETEGGEPNFIIKEEQ